MLACYLTSVPPTDQTAGENMKKQQLVKQSRNVFFCLLAILQTPVL